MKPSRRRVHLAEMALITDMASSFAKAYGQFLIRMVPDHHPTIDGFTNWASSKLGPYLVVIYDYAIHLAILLLISTPREIQLTVSQVQTPAEDITPAYDYIIVGGGTTGCLIANRLVSNTSARVLLIESGGVNNYVNLFGYINSLNVNDDPKPFDMNWNLRSVAQSVSHKYTDAHKNRTAYEGGGKGIGGTHQINWQIFSLGKSDDYNRWQDKFNAEGWNSDLIKSAIYQAAYQNGYNGFKLQDGVLPLEPTPKYEQIPVGIADVDNIKDYTDAFTRAGSLVTGTEVVEDHNTDPLGFSLMQHTVQTNGYTGHAGRRFIHSIRRDKTDPRNQRLHILLNTNVTKINFKNEAGALRAISVDVVSKTERRRTFTVNNEVIVTAGFYGTPALLLRSDVGPGKAKLDLRGVGKNLHNHVASIGVPVIFPDGKSYSDVSIKQLFKAFIDGTGRFRSQNGVTAIGFDIAVDKDVQWNETRPNIEYMFFYPSVGTDNARRLFVNSAGLQEEIFDEFFVEAYGGSKHFPKDGVMGTATLLHSKARGNVTIDGNGDPVINLQYLTDKNDLPTLVLGHARLVRILYVAFEKLKGAVPNKALRGCEKEWNAWVGTQDPNKVVYKNYSECLTEKGPSASRVCLDQSITQTEKEYLECYIKYMTTSTWHSGGTARIGSCSANDGTVVDNRCKVCQTENVRISDASILPEPLSGHNIATLFAVAQTCSRMIIEDNEKRNITIPAA